MRTKRKGVRKIEQWRSGCNRKPNINRENPKKFRATPIPKEKENENFQNTFSQSNWTKKQNKNNQPAHTKLGRICLLRKTKIKRWHFTLFKKSSPARQQEKNGMDWYWKSKKIDYKKRDCNKLGILLQGFERHTGKSKIFLSTNKKILVC